MSSSPRLVPLLLADSHKEALREECLSAIHGVLGDLATSGLRDSAVTASAGEVYRRLLEGLDAEEIQVPPCPGSPKTLWPYPVDRALPRLEASGVPEPTDPRAVAGDPDNRSSI
jgi:hypothetical protein